MVPSLFMIRQRLSVDHHTLAAVVPNSIFTITPTVQSLLVSVAKVWPGANFWIVTVVVLLCARVALPAPAEEFAVQRSEQVEPLLLVRYRQVELQPTSSSCRCSQCRKKG